jgi:putative transposase
MSRYRRLFAPGGTWFFTVNLEDRASTALTEEIDLLRAVWRDVMRDHPFRTDAAVILPDHLHAIWTLPPGDSDFPTRWKKIKAGFSRHCRAVGQPGPSKQRKGEKGIWQRRFWEHMIRDDADLAAHVAYCHWNPVRHGLVARPEDWPHSSVHRRVGETHLRLSGMAAGGKCAWVSPTLRGVAHSRGGLARDLE